MTQINKYKLKKLSRIYRRNKRQMKRIMNQLIRKDEQ